MSRTLNIWFLVNILCVFAVVTQLAFNFRDFLFPRLTNTRVETSGIQEENFPLIFKICVQPAFNDTALEETGYGYGGFQWYFQGRSAFNNQVHAVLPLPVHIILADHGCLSHVALVG